MVLNVHRKIGTLRDRGFFGCSAYVNDKPLQLSVNTPNGRSSVIPIQSIHRRALRDCIAFLQL